MKNSEKVQYKVCTCNTGPLKTNVHYIWEHIYTSIIAHFTFAVNQKHHLFAYHLTTKREKGKTATGKHWYKHVFCCEHIEYLCLCVQCYNVHKCRKKVC